MKQLHKATATNVIVSEAKLDPSTMTPLILNNSCSSPTSPHRYKDQTSDFRGQMGETTGELFTPRAYTCLYTQ